MNDILSQNNFSIETFSPQSRVWIYQADRTLNEFEVLQIKNVLTAFTQQWTAHQMPLKAATEIRFNRFVIFYVDENQNEISGCGIDKSVQLLKQIEQQLSINFFNRMQIGYQNGDEISTFLLSDLQKLVAEKIISADTIIFNNLVNSKHELDTDWQVKLKDSWLGKRLGIAN